LRVNCRPWELRFVFAGWQSCRAFLEHLLREGGDD
jgi:hypothetical protein